LLGLTGAEVSINALPAGASVPFVHSHKQNEEIYAVLEGEGKAVIDGESVALKAGDWVRIAPAAKRQFFAAADKGIKYVCIQVKENSLEGYTMTDAVV
ncbi:MAG: cupin domain-containing protein, partial [Clostridia bacterium]|nr:cupin domain-containing protein [Clostridia bacterium]